MGSEDLFHKTRERNANDLKRKKSTHSVPARQPQPRILIVCEDSKSSAFYLEDLAKKDLELNAVMVEGKRCGSAPSSVLAFAQEQYENSVKDRNQYDRVYCVFDRDQHPCFDAIVHAISSLKPKNTFYAITTTPCFEFWLLHFVYDTSPYQSSGNKSSCDNVNSKLKLSWADYGKNKRGIYAHTKQHIQTAINNAKLLVNHNLTTSSDNPQTNIHELVEYLQLIPR